MPLLPDPPEWDNRMETMGLAGGGPIDIQVIRLYILHLEDEMRGMESQIEGEWGCYGDKPQDSPWAEAFRLAAAGEELPEWDPVELVWRLSPKASEQ